MNLVEQLDDIISIKHADWSKAVVNKQILLSIIPKEFIDLDASHINFYSDWISIGYTAPKELSDAEKYNWARQMKLLLGNIMPDIKWKDHVTVGEYTGGAWFHGQVKLDGWELWINVNTPVPPRCQVIKEEIKEMKEVVTIRYRAECPPDFNEVS